MNKQLTMKILGSCSPYPKQSLACPGYLIELNNSKILLDCGPGVCSKLNMPKDLENLNVFISHFHKDHYLDIYSLGYAAYVYNGLAQLKNKIKVYIPKIDKSDIEYQDYCLLKKFKEQFFDIIEYDADTIVNIENVTITFMVNYHSIKTYSTKLVFGNKYTIVYASDLGYNSKNDIVKFSNNANLLLIESTFVKKDGRNNQFHLHAYEAAEIAKEANVKKLVLTHFWPEYSNKVYRLEAKMIFKNTSLALPNKIITLK